MEPATLDLFLRPGDWYFGGADTRIRTLLGSCVAIVLWHPERRLGGICHYLLPGRRRPGQGPDGRYADEALALLLGAIDATGTQRQDYRARLFGGASMLAASGGIGPANCAAGRRLLAEHALAVAAADLGGRGHRQLVFEIGSGAVWVRRHPPAGEAR